MNTRSNTSAAELIYFITIQIKHKTHTHSTAICLSSPQIVHTYKTLFIYLNVCVFGLAAQKGRTKVFYPCPGEGPEREKPKDTQE